MASTVKVIPCALCRLVRQSTHSHQDPLHLSSGLASSTTLLKTRWYVGSGVEVAQTLVAETLSILVTPADYLFGYICVFSALSYLYIAMCIY